MDRLLANTGAVLSVTFYADESLLDPDGNVATVTVTKSSDGSAIAMNAATTRASAGLYRYTLAPVSTPDLLTLAWTGTFSGISQTVTTYAEVVGNRIVPMSDVRAQDVVLANTTKYPTATLERLRVSVEDEFEQACRRSFIRRFGKTTTSSLWTGQTVVPLDHNGAESVLSVKIDGVTVAPTTYYVEEKRFLVFESQSMTAGSTLVVAYTHGLSDSPTDIREAAIKRMRSKAVDQSTGIPDRATSFQQSEGGTYSLATPGRAGWVTAIPEVDVVLQRWSLKTPGVG